ncbi:TetR/AcrR family transcriptional regulator [Thalassospira lucentensis]|uniref:TetR/AcrR family transcriptional regulator n=1 Tax=Thalassospira lucentensis TaxID=168935 RepID=UPI00294259CB|nr:TetR/AcrR family transcriptional regulator [Thalassospira lucentensis]WOI11681.1 TetR/AcrR family transcriptional regulator [Thalassospira lucentensis]
MRVSREQATRNRQNVIDVASRLFREHGFDGIGLKDLMKSAGLTQGAFYKQFASKEDLIAQASQRALGGSTEQWIEATEKNPDNPLEAAVAFYLSKDHQEARMDGCPIVALGADAARQSPDVKASFEAGVKAHLDVLGQMISTASEAEREEKSIAILSLMVGALTLARVVNDPEMAKSFLDAAAKKVREIA